MKPPDSLPHHLQDSERAAGPARVPRRPDTAGRRNVRAAAVSDLQLLAWAMANWGYSVPDGGIYRAEAMDLYREDLHQRIVALFADLDAQNTEIDTELGNPPGPAHGDPTDSWWDD